MVARYHNLPDKLSDVGVSLALHNAYLGEHLGSYKADREVLRGQTYIELIKAEKSATQAENTSRAKTSELQGQILRLDLLHKDVNTLINMIQSRLKVLAEEGRGQV